MSAMSGDSPSLLIHPLRRKIYSLLAENPGTYFFNLAKFLELPQGTLNWHLKRLEDAKLIKSIKYAGKRIFYPAELRTAEAERIFTALAKLPLMALFRALRNNNLHSESDAVLKSSIS